MPYYKAAHEWEIDTTDPIPFDPADPNASRNPEPYMGRTVVSSGGKYQFRPASLLGILRAKGTDFQRRTYNALQNGTATEHQQQAAASGIVLCHADYAEAADTIEELISEVLRLTEAVAFAHGEGCEWPDDPLPNDCIARRLLDGFELASVDTHAKRGDSTQIEAPSPMGSAVAEGRRPHAVGNQINQGERCEGRCQQNNGSRTRNRA